MGEVPEWTIGAVSKTAVAFVATEGSNPSLSAAAFPLVNIINSLSISGI